LHVEAVGDGSEPGAKGIFIGREASAGRLELDPHEEAAGFDIGILLAVEDEAVDRGEVSADRGNDADPVLARQSEDMTCL
jgi:hypothetical protein